VDRRALVAAGRAGTTRARLSALAQQRHRRDPREPLDLAGHVRLIGVSGLGGVHRELAAPVRDLQEALEAQDPLEGLRAVAGGGPAAASQLTLREAELRGERVDARARVGEPPRRLAHGAIGLAAGAQAQAGAHEPRERLPRLEIAGQRSIEVGPQRRERHARIAERLQAEPERAAARARTEADPDDHRSGAGLDEDRPGVRSREHRALARPPDEVDAGVGQDAGRRRRTRSDAHPGAFEARPEPALAIARPQIHPAEYPSTSVPFKTSAPEP
jgi:hypothetical protein